MARIVVLFRRIEMLSGEQSTGSWLERDSLRLSAERMEVQWEGQAVPLTVTELWIVHSLARHPGHVRSRQQLMDDANILVDDQTITSHVKRIRRKFKAIDDSFDKLDTVYGAGYRWNAGAA
jgi:two-component system OmpR family response regulator